MNLYPHVHRHGFRAMGSEIAIWLQQADEPAARRELQRAQALFAATERWMTRFDPASELSRLNARAGEWVEVSPALWSAVNRALDLAAVTGGLFDPTLLRAVTAAGYDASFDVAWHAADRPMAASWRLDERDGAPVGRWWAVELDPARLAVRLPDGAGIDLGGIGKGLTARQVVEQLSAWGPCLVDAGGDLTAGDGPDGAPGWPVAVAYPGAGPSGASPLNVWLAGATLATSGADYRWWTQGGARRHHLIDPRTGQPAASDVLTATVLAADAGGAEAWATALWVAGSGEGARLAVANGLAVALFTGEERYWLSPAFQPALA